MIVTPGLESLAKTELLSHLPGLGEDSVKILGGGIELETNLVTGLLLNKQLRLPTRILVRVSEFGCRDFPKLFKKLSTLAWSDWVPDLKNVDFQVSTHGSRLKLKNRIEETCLSGRIAYLKKKGRPHSRVITGPEADFAMFIRIVDDVCMISLDTSGDRLHKRGLRESVSDAPLRETLASALLKSIEAVYLKDMISQKAPSIELVDPMMGAATFLLEASAAGTSVETREFSYELNSALLEHAERERLKGVGDSKAASGESSVEVLKLASVVSAEAQVAVPEASQSTDLTTIEFAKLTGFEMNAKTVTAARKNLQLEQESRRKNHLNVAEIEVVAGDFFEAKPLEACKPERKRWLVCNPPYGERIKVEGRLSDFYDRLMHQSEKIVHPDYVALLIPQKVNSRMLNLPASWRFRQALKFSNGGIPVQALVYSRKG